jgi:hypothetical protein
MVRLATVGHAKLLKIVKSLTPPLGTMISSSPRRTRLCLSDCNVATNFF